MEKDERSIEGSIIGACHDVNEMRAGKMREKPLEEFFAELKTMINEEQNVIELKKLSPAKFAGDFFICRRIRRKIRRE